jgi:bacterioferritin (cytochrome b1)
MGTLEILQSLPQLTPTDQLKIAETALQLIQQDHQTLTRDQRRQQMAIAAMAAVEDYSVNKLIAFTALDGEDFHEAKQ